MVLICLICNNDELVTTEKSFLFKHYLKHLHRDICAKVIELGISNTPNRENRYSLINSLITYSMRHGV